MKVIICNPAAPAADMAARILLQGESSASHSSLRPSVSAQHAGLMEMNRMR